MPKEKTPKMSDEDYQNVLRQIISIPTDHLPVLLEGNKANKAICEMIKDEMAEREKGLKRIPMIEEAMALYGE